MTEWLDLIVGSRRRLLQHLAAVDLSVWAAAWSLLVGAAIAGGLAVVIPVLLAPPDPARLDDSFARRIEAGEPGTARRDRFVLGAAAGALLGLAVLAVRIRATPPGDRLLEDHRAQPPGPPDPGR